MGPNATLGYPEARRCRRRNGFNQFWTNLTPRIVAAGYKRALAASRSETRRNASEMQSYLAAFVQALRQSKAAGGGWSYHAYTINYTTDVGTEIWYFAAVSAVLQLFCVGVS